jgi:uncharacterized protein
MADFFLDTSALAKRYVTETGSKWIRSILAVEDNYIFIARITQVEIASAFSRRTLDKKMTARDHRAALDLFAFHMVIRFKKVEIDIALCANAARLADMYALRAYDSVQLACALRANQALRVAQRSNLTFLSADMRLLQGAQNEGLPVDNPDDH